MSDTSTETYARRQAANTRLVRIIAPAAQVRAIDELVMSGLGGFETRQEFILDAIEAHLAEVKHGEMAGAEFGPNSGRDVSLVRTEVSNGHRKATVDPSLADHASIVALVEPSVPEALSHGEPIEQLRTIGETALTPNDTPSSLLQDVGELAVEHELLLGLHNRDYPSLWVAHLLATETRDGLVAVREFYDVATARAWRYASSLGTLEAEMKVRLTGLFPTNLAKPQSAEDGFRNFAIGSLPRRTPTSGRIPASGALYNWGVAGVVRNTEGEPMIGLTHRGHALLRQMEGLIVDWPHDARHAQAFCAYLREHAPWDWAGFQLVLDRVAARPNRTELMAAFSERYPALTEVMVSTNAAGYVARAREWGLVEVKLGKDNRYALTDLGEVEREKGTVDR